MKKIWCTQKMGAHEAEEKLEDYNEKDLVYSKDGGT